MEAEHEAAPATEAYCVALADALRSIEGLPLVNSVVLVGTAGNALNEIRVRANLSSDFIEKKARRQPYVACSKERPTQLAAAQRLLERLTSDEYKSELAVATAAHSSSAGASAPATAPTAFDRLLAGRVAHRALKLALTEAEQAANDARDAERSATAVRKVAEATAAETKAGLAAFEPMTAVQRQAAAKRQKTVGDAGLSVQEAATTEAATTIEAVDATTNMLWTGKGQPPPNWSSFGSYSHSTYQKLETEVQRWRAVEPIADVQRDPPPFGERNGALSHWRRGLIGAVQDWADGSLDNVVMLLLRLISHFKLTEQILEKLAGVELANAKVDACIVERLTAAITMVAGCQTKQQWLELCILLLLRGVAPVPAASGSHAGMEAPVARRLGSNKPLPTGSRKRRGKLQVGAALSHLLPLTSYLLPLSLTVYLPCMSRTTPSPQQSRTASRLMRQPRRRCDHVRSSPLAMLCFAAASWPSLNGTMLRVVAAALPSATRVLRRRSPTPRASESRAPTTRRAPAFSGRSRASCRRHAHRASRRWTPLCVSMSVRSTSSPALRARTKRTVASATSVGTSGRCLLPFRTLFRLHVRFMSVFMSCPIPRATPHCHRCCKR